MSSAYFSIYQWVSPPGRSADFTIEPPLAVVPRYEYSDWDDDDWYDGWEDDPNPYIERHFTSPQEDAEAIFGNTWEDD